MRPNPNLPPEHQQMQSELYGRIDAQHRKDRDDSLLFKLKIILFAALVIVSCIGISKCQSNQATKEKETELNCKPINQ